MTFIPPSLRSTRIQRRQSAKHAAFTLVEMLVAMTVTLLIMAALTRSFGYVGRQIKESRSDVSLSNQLRDVQVRLQTDLAGCTVTMNPSADDAEKRGYFMYYEGPVTDATSSLFRTAIDSDSGNLELPDVRYGDFDDYIAFTAVATGDNWFTGKVPRYILDQATSGGGAYTVNANSFDPVVIRSKYAEIIYFASPEYDVSTLPASPAYVDTDGDTDLGSGTTTENGFPDRLKLHRRVLLIRPDLNLMGTAGPALPIQSNGALNFMQADEWPVAATTTVNGGVNRNFGWLFGMAGVHQQCDLSVRRVYDSAGNDTAFVAANSVIDLAKPENRFAHVRVPASLIGGTGELPTSMPVLALSGQATVLNSVASDGTRVGPPLSPNAGPIVTPSSLSGFLRPEFVLGYDYAHIELPGDQWGLDRRGEDVLTNHALGFDVRVFDRTASVISTAAGLAVSPSDPAYRQVVQAESASIASNTSYQISRTRGDYVDLAYATLAGGSLRGWQARYIDRLSTAGDGGIPISNAALVGRRQAGPLLSQYSGLIETSEIPFAIGYQPSLFRSGKLLSVSGTVRIYQPTFDTYSNHFERDGYVQGNIGTLGTVWGPINSATADLGANALDDDGRHGVDDPGEKETSPPFLSQPESIQVTIRVEDPNTRLIQQLSVSHGDR
ncbi:MAG: type II secretion system protein J [Rubripirellula sp.]